jgi:hypothetical protein
MIAYKRQSPWTWSDVSKKFSDVNINKILASYAGHVTYRIANPSYLGEEIGGFRPYLKNKLKAKRRVWSKW